MRLDILIESLFVLFDTIRRPPALRLTHTSDKDGFVRCSRILTVQLRLSYWNINIVDEQSAKKESPCHVFAIETAKNKKK